MIVALMELQLRRKDMKIGNILSVERDDSGITIESAAWLGDVLLCAGVALAIISAVLSMVN